MKLSLRVTREDIRNGEPESVHMCPIACAIQRELGLDSSKVFVSEDEIGIREWVFKTPKQAARFIRMFDGLKPVKSTEITLTQLI